MLCAESERQEAIACRNHDEFDAGQYGTMSDRIARIFGRLGIGRFSREINATPPEQAMASKVASHFRRRTRGEGLPPP
jgi:hypothetical protein